MERILIINAHQRWENFAEGALNKSMTEAASAQLQDMGYEVRTTVVDNGYKVGEELDNHLWADAVIIQTPVYWMGVPYLFKQYIDEVFTAGLGTSLAKHDGRVIDEPEKRYGTGGLMVGKKYMISSTWNAPEYAFEDNEFFEGRDIDGVFWPLHKTYQFCGYKPLPSFACYDVMKNPNIDNDLSRFKTHLSTLFSDISK